MITENRTFNVVPHPSVHPFLGNGSGDRNEAVACWGQVLARAALDNEFVFSRNEWNFLADMLRNVKHDPMVGNPGELLPAQVMDSAWSENLGARWLNEDLDESVLSLSRKVGRLDYVHAWSVFTACAWFWTSHSIVDRTKDAWWTLAYRKEKASKTAKEKLAPDGLPVSCISQGYWWIWFPGNGRRTRGRRA